MSTKCLLEMCHYTLCACALLVHACLLPTCRLWGVLINTAQGGVLRQICTRCKTQQDKASVIRLMLARLLAGTAQDGLLYILQWLAAMHTSAVTAQAVHWVTQAYPKGKTSATHWPLGRW